MEVGVCGRVTMKDDGVLGGSMFGMTFFHESMKVESTAGVAGTSEENARDLVNAVVRAKRREACLNIFRFWRFVDGSDKKLQFWGWRLLAENEKRFTLLYRFSLLSL